jgi:filamentous hemagglutinin family protein
MNRNSGDVVWRSLLLNSLVVSGVLSFQCDRAFSQVTPDDTLGDESSVVNTRDATNESIDGGAIRGQNLFHSFEEFNVGEDRGVYFANPDAVTDIFSRVTGDNVSNILGTLGVDGAANLFLINPNGIVFGKGASLDVQGSFAATTADGIEFGDRGFFGVTDPESPKLLTINPSAYLFNQVAPGAIANSSKASADSNPETSFDDDFFGLRVPDGQSLLLLGGNVETNGGGLVASGGRIDIGAVTGQGVVGLNNNGSLNIPDSILRGNVSLTNSAGFLVSGDDGGDIAIAAKNISLDSASGIYAGILSNLDLPNAQAGDLNLNATGTVIVKDDNSFISNNVFAGAVGSGGDIIIQAGNLVAINGGQISSSTFGEGYSGDISITVDNTITLVESVIVNNVQDSDAVGNAGNIEITTGSLSATNGSQINSFTRGRGNAGDITIQATDAITFDGVDSNDNNSSVFSSVEAGGIGNGGDINITAGSLSLTNGAKLNASVDEASNFLAANFDINSSTPNSSGNISILTSNLNLNNSAEISTSNLIGENGGDISINAAKLQLNNGSDISTISGTLKNSEQQNSGASGKLKIRATDSISLDNDSSLFTGAAGFGSGGDILLDTKKISINSGIISSSSINIAEFLKTFSETLDLNTVSELLGFDPAEGISVDEFISNFVNENSNDDIEQGNSGDVIIKASESVDIVSENSNTVGITTSSTGKANGGNISISSPRLSIRQGTITTGTGGAGNSGNINITNAESVEIVDGTLSANTSVNSSGNGGNLNIFTQNLLVEKDGFISTSTQGTGEAGNIAINAFKSIVINGASNNNFSSRITSDVEEEAEGDAGIIDLKTSSLEITNGGIVGTGAFGDGNAGEIIIDADSIMLEKDSIISSRSRTSGNAGNITLDILDTLTLKDSFINSNSDLSTGGKINITTGNIRLQGDSDIRTEVDSGADNGGDITLKANSILAFDDSDIFAFARDGQGGNITLDTPAFFAENFTLNSLTANPDDLDLNARADVNATGAVSGSVDIPDVSSIQNSLTELANDSLNTDELVANSCVVPVGDRGEGKFIITGTQSLPLRPGDGIPSNFPTGEVRSVPEKHSSWQPGDPIVEPQGAYRLANGKLVLSRECSQ